MKWPEFGYVRAGSLEEFWRLRAEAGEDAKVLAGGQSLLATLAFRLSQPSVLIDITGIAALRGIALEGETLRIAALTRHCELATDPLIRDRAPLLAAAAPLIAHPAIRNRGTIGGSLALADPAAELPACALALEAVIVLASAEGERRVGAADFFLGLFETAMREDEIIVAIEVPHAGSSRRVSIREIARRSGDYAMAGLALSAEMTGATVRSIRPVYFGLGSVPVLATGAAAALAGRVPDAAALAEAEAALEADLDPPDDLHGPPAMKRHLARVLLRRALGDIAPEARLAA
jgi:carbon-monoxide dehydrogenase medium subunit